MCYFVHVICPYASLTVRRFDEGGRPCNRVARFFVSGQSGAAEEMLRTPIAASSREAGDYRSGLVEPGGLVTGCGAERDEHKAPVADTKGLHQNHLATFDTVALEIDSACLSRQGFEFAVPLETSLE